MTNSSPWKITMLLIGKPSINGSFSMAMLVYQKVNSVMRILVYEYNIYIYPSSPRSILFIDIRYTYIHSHMSLCHALSRPTTYTYQLKHVKTTACAHGHIPTWTKVLKLETCLCPGFPTTPWRMIRHFFSGSLLEASRAQILCAAEWLSLGNPKKWLELGSEIPPNFPKWYPNELGSHYSISHR